MTEANLTCTFCGSHHGHRAWPVTDIFEKTRELIVCSDCGTYYLWPGPLAEELSQAYDDSYYGQTEAKFKWKAVENAIDRFRMGRARRMSRRLQAGARVLDIGCGNGRYLMHLKHLGDYELHGTELPGGSAVRASRIEGIKLQIGRFEDIQYEKEYFDAISLYHVFEHLEEPRLALDRIDQIIRNNGILVFSFPNIRSFQSRMLKGAWLHLDPPRHLFFPDPGRFEHLMKGKGYELICKRFFSAEQNPMGMIQGILNLLLRRRDVFFERIKGNKSYATEYGKLNLFLQMVFFLCAMPFCIISDIFESAFNAGATVEMTFRKEKPRSPRE